MVKFIQKYKKEHNQKKNVTTIQYFLYRYQDIVSNLLHYPVFNSLLLMVPETYLTDYETYNND